MIVKSWANGGEQRASKEHDLAVFLRTHGVPAPTTRLCQTSKGFAVELVRLPGRTLDEWGPEVSSASLRGCLAQMAQLLRQIHSIGVSGGFGRLWSLDSPPNNSNQKYMAGRINWVAGRIEELTGVPDLLAVAISKLRECSELFSSVNDAVFCHQDFHHSNVLFERVDDAFELSGIIDFENAVLADPLLDVARTLVFIEQRQDAGGPEAFLDAYGQRTPIEERRLQAYRLFQAADLWQSCAHGGRPEHAQLLEPTLVDAVHRI